MVTSMVAIPRVLSASVCETRGSSGCSLTSALLDHVRAADGTESLRGLPVVRECLGKIVQTESQVDPVRQLIRELLGKFFAEIYGHLQVAERFFGLP